MKKENGKAMSGLGKLRAQLDNDRAKLSDSVSLFLFVVCCCFMFCKHMHDPCETTKVTTTRYYCVCHQGESRKLKGKKVGIQKENKYLKLLVLP